MKVSQKWSVAAVVLIGPVLALMDTTIVSVLLSQLQETFQTDFDTITWVASAYFLAEAAAIPAIGYLSDRLGTKQINAHAEPIIEGVMNQLMLIAPLEALERLQMLQDLSQLVYQHLWPFLSTYGITLGMVKVQLFLYLPAFQIASKQA